MKSQEVGEQKNRVHGLVITAFVIVACALVGVTLYRKYFTVDAKPIVRTRNVVPVSNTNRTSSGEEPTTISETTEATSFITLAPNETLLSSTTFDFDGDNSDDQIIAVRKSESPYIYLLVAMYVPSTNTYIRAAELETGIVRSRTFSYGGMDVSGTRRMALVYQGILEDNTSVMRIYHCQGNGTNTEMVLIGNFSSDGTIFLQQSDSTAAYELAQAAGNSFSVWVYSSDVNGIYEQDNSAGGQIQTEYRWSASARRFVQVNRRYVAGAILAAEERSRILDGTIDTFVRFLNGLWYKTSNEGESIRFMYFDYEAREIIFLYDDAQEVYLWEGSNLNRNGVYLTSSNAEIVTMQRRFDIALASRDTVQMHIIDDVRSLIREAAVWDGEYRKMSSSSSLTNQANKIPSEKIKIALENNSEWRVNNVDTASFSKGEFIFKFSGIENRGAYSIYTVAGDSIIQFRTFAESANVPNNSQLFPAYKMEFGQTEIPAKGRIPAHTEENRDEIILTPVSLSPNGASTIEGDTIILTHVIEENESN